MGSYSDADHLLPFISKEVRDEALAILQEIVDALAKEECPYKGPMYGQFMLTKNGPKIIEINARLGDPEAMNVLSILETNLLTVVKAICAGKLKEENVVFKDEATVCKYVVPLGYVCECEPGAEITVDEEACSKINSRIYYANVNVDENGRLTTGTSRTIGVVGIGETIDVAEQNCEMALKCIKCDKMFVRHDIGTRPSIESKIAKIKKLFT